MKTLKVTVDVWKRLRQLAFDQEISIGKVIEGLLDGK